VYVGVPPLKDVEVERVDDWPLSIVLGLTDIVGEVRVDTTRVPALVTVESATALTVKVNLPCGVAPVVVIVSVEVPVTSTGFGEKLAEAPVGSPLVTESITESAPLPL